MIIENLKTKRAKEIYSTYGITVAYVFGSHAKGTAIPTSDIDIAAYFDRAIDEDGYFNLKLNLTAELMKLLERNDIDVVVLNNASPLLKYNVFADGETVYVDSEKDRVRFEVGAMRDYFDTARLREIMLKAYMDRSV
ncbi:MAG TPA: nucleotidyltransferase domain-containing protein [Actinobacteria bacterium]|nr:nucleotidyltransferase domain-containing protein [Actinomycetota bacterium]